MFSFRRFTAADGALGYRVSCGARQLGEAFNCKGQGLPWRGVAPDGVTYGATSKARIAERLLLHAAARVASAPRRGSYSDLEDRPI